MGFFNRHIAERKKPKIVPCFSQYLDLMKDAELIPLFQWKGKPGCEYGNFHLPMPLRLEDAKGFAGLRQQFLVCQDQMLSNCVIIIPFNHKLPGPLPQ